MKNIFIFILSISYALAYKDKLLHCITGEVAAGSYKYYSLIYDGFIKVILITEFGDADLYVSQLTTKPTYELDQYCLKSATYGADIVLIPESFQRPVGIGVYGHPSRENSKYILLVYETTDTEYPSYEGNSQIYNYEEEKPSIPMSIACYLIDLIFQILF